MSRASDFTLNQPPRCLHCGYVLLGLPAGRCPECGSSFDPENPATFTTTMPFVRWRYWAPGFLLAVIGGMALYTLLILISGFGWAVTLAAPFAFGAVLGYGCRVRPFVLTLLSIAGIGSVMLGIFSLNLVGVFCGLMLAGMAMGPVLLGTAVGYILRISLKNSRFGQRSYLPTLSFFLVAVLLGIVDRVTFSPHEIESVVTSMHIPVPVGKAWNALMFYEEVGHRPPWLLRLGLPRPLFTRGDITHIGGVRVCVYSKGRLAKRVTERVPEQRLAFDVIEQDKIENRSIRLTTGSFNFVREGPAQTRVDLVTSYQPKLGPRWVWRPAEALAVHTLHRHVLEGMRQKAAEP